MQGYLDHLETSGHLVHKKSWTRRFARLNEPFHGLELFTDETMKLRTARLELAGAQVATADELGELLSASGTNIPIENSRRFVFRIIVAPGTRHYFCAEVVTSDDGVDAAASRQNLNAWLRALRAVVVRASTPPVSAVVGPLDLRDVHAQLSPFLDDVHVAAHVTVRRAEPGHKGQYELAVVAWTLQRELVRNDNDDDQPQWAVLEYARSWSVTKTSEQFRAFDEQLRMRFRDDLRDLSLPSFTGVKAFLQRRDDESERRVASYDAYWHELLALPAFSVFGSDAGAMLDAFLEISTHVQTLQRQVGLKGKSKRVVPWPVRERFEQLFNLHLEMVRSQQEKRKSKTTRASQRKPSERAARDTDKHHHHHHHRSCSEKPVVETPPPSPVAVVQQEPEPTDSVHDRIARIGHKLLVEAFHTTQSTQ